MKTDILNKVNRSFHKVGFAFKKHSPELLLVTGIITGVAGTVLACKATLKVNDILEESKEEIEKIHKVANDETMAKLYTEKDCKKDLTIVYAQTGLKLVKLYGPSIALGALSISSILASNNVMKKRNVALAAAYTAVDTSFKEYRGRVVERFGEKIDKELKYNIKAQTVDVIETDSEGNETVVTKTVETVEGLKDVSEFAKFFDEYSDYWEKDSEYNLMFLKAQQAAANDRLKANGYLFLNEVYDMLGIRKTKAGQVVGWIYDPVNPLGDNYVDFGIYDVHKRCNREFVNGYNRSILLDFNVDGNIWELM